jgi:NTE family protein
MNAVVLASGLLSGGRAGAQQALHAFWKRVSQSAHSASSRSPFHAMFFDSDGVSTPWSTLGPWGASLAFWSAVGDTFTRTFSPYKWNPLNFNPLLDLISGTVDFERLRRAEDIQLFISATSVRTGALKVFRNAELSADAVMASACLPQFFRAVEIDGEAYWDGGFSANPALMPLVVSDASPDIVIVQVNPIVRHDTPRSARDIINRVNEISFNTALIKELRAINLMQQLIGRHDVDIGPAGRTYIHLIHADAEVQDLSASSKLNAEWSYLTRLFARGRGWADAWLAANYERIGHESTFDLDDWFSDPVAPHTPGC